MKKIISMILALLLCAGALAEGAVGFEVNGLKWGSSMEEFQAAEGEPIGTNESDGWSFAYYGDSEVQRTAVFRDGQLRAYVVVEFNADIDAASSRREALIQAYGWPMDKDIERILLLLSALGDADREHYVYRSWSNWALEDGTFIASASIEYGNYYTFYFDEAEILKILASEAADGM